MNTHVKLFGTTVIVLCATWSIATATPAQAEVRDDAPAAISATTAPTVAAPAAPMEAPTADTTEPS